MSTAWKSLQELCLTHITMTLEQYSTNVLSLLPKKFREQLLHNIPVLDICRLEEDSSFTAGIDMESIWKELYVKLLGCNGYSLLGGNGGGSLTCKELLLSQFFNTIIQGDRPYGYFHVLSRAEKRSPWVSRQMNENQPAKNHGIDYVNFLVATKSCSLKQSVPVPTNPRDSGGFTDIDRYGPVIGTMNRHEVTLVKGPIPPGRTYHESCRTNQLVPPRYTKLFLEDSCYLPDSTALQLITEKCHFRPKHLYVDVPTFATFLFNVVNDCGRVDCLKDYFQGVKSVSIQGVIEKSQRDKVISGTHYDDSKSVADRALELILQSSLKDHFEGTESSSIQSVIEKNQHNKVVRVAESEACTGVAGQALKLILQSPNPSLTDLTVSLNIRDDVLKSIEPVLVGYGGLKKFSLKGFGDVTPNFSTLCSITKHQPLLSTLSVSISEVTQVYNSFHQVTRSPVFSKTHFLSWIRTCFENPSLEELKLDISQAPSEFILQIIIVFLSTPCSREQTLTFKMVLGNNKHKYSKPLPRPSMPLLPSLKAFAKRSQPPKEPSLPPKSASQSSNVPPDPSLPPVPPPPPPLPRPVQSNDPPPTYQFDDAVTLKYKCLSFDSCSIHDSFINSFLRLAPLKVKKMTFQKIGYPSGPDFLRHIAQDWLVEMESLELFYSTLPRQTKEFFDFLSLKKSLKSVTYSYSTARSSTRSADDIEDTSFEGFEKKLVFSLITEKIYLLTKI